MTQARRIGRPIRYDPMPAADPLDGGCRPAPGRVPCPATGGSRRPFQGRRDAAQGPPEHPAAPDQQDHLVIMLTHQLTDPLTGPAAGAAARFWPNSGVIARSSRRCRVSKTSKMTRWSCPRRSRTADGQCIKSAIGEVSAIRPLIGSAKPQETNQSPAEFRKQARVFFVSSRSGARGPQNRLRRFGEIPGGACRAGGGCTTPRGLYLPLAPALPGQHRMSPALFFLRIFRKLGHWPDSDRQPALWRKSRTRPLARTSAHLAAGPTRATSTSAEMSSN